jgi:hypothetical protein
MFYLAFGLLIISSIANEKTKKPVFLFFNVIICLVLAVGLFSSGLDRQEGSFLIEDISATQSTITPVVTNYAANYSNPLVLFAAWAATILTLFFTVKTLEEVTKNEAAKDYSPDSD